MSSLFNLLFLAGVLTSPDSTIANKKVGVKEVVFDSAVSNMIWMGDTYKNVLVLTVKGRLYMSTTGGDSWDDITRKFVITRNPYYSATPFSAPDIPNIIGRSIHANSADKNMVLLTGSKRNHFITDDAGLTWRPIRHNVPIHSYVFHPDMATWALLSTWTEGCDSSRTIVKGAKSESAKCVHELYVTRNAGRSFTLVTDYVVQFAWSTSVQTRIFFTHHTKKKGKQNRLSLWSRDVDFAYTDNFGLSVSKKISHGNKFLVSKNYIFVAKVVDVDKQTVSLQVSSDNGKSFDSAQLPIDLEEKSYTILDTSEGAVIIHVNHGTDHDTGNVYISDSTGLRYALSLANGIRGLSGDCEFDKVLSLEGVYIANFKVKDEVGDDVIGELTNDEAIESDTGDQLGDRSRKFWKGRSTDTHIRTVISFDKGGVWQYLRPPKVDSLGKPTQCSNTTSKEPCYLHLHGITNSKNYAPFYSLPNALGIIMGVGNIGPHLINDLEEQNTYLSRDGGVSWIEAHKGAFIYEYGDHGGLIVMANDFKKTNQVVFSWNEGNSWFDFDMSTDSVDVDNIVTDPDSATVRFMLYGTRGDAGVLYHLDFGALNQPKCKGVWAADSVSSDYEKWSPSDGRVASNLNGDPSCLLGRQMTYTRRKPASECFNGEVFDRPVISKPCECTMEDFECELGFYRKVGSLNCVPNDAIVYDGQTNSNLLNDLITEHCHASGGSYPADAYRKVPGDACVGGWQPQKFIMPCPMLAGGYGGFSRFALWIFSVAICIIFLMAGFVLLNTKYPSLMNLNLGLESFDYVKYNVIRKKMPRKNSNADFSEFREEDGTDLHEAEDPFFGFDDAEETAPKLIVTTRQFDDKEIVDESIFGEDVPNLIRSRKGPGNDDDDVELL